MRASLIRIFIILMLLAPANCLAGRKGVFHRVRPGETLWRISYTYGVDMQDVAEINNIKDPEEIKAGKRLFIPGAKKALKVPKAIPPQAVETAAKAETTEKVETAEAVEKVETAKPAPVNYEPGIALDKERFAWPLEGKIISEFGMRHGVHHDGIDIKAPAGTPVTAADDGEVVFSDSDMRGYGNVVIIKHRDDFFTVYSHNKENLVDVGDNVTKGEVIAEVGSTGNATTAHLHFEVRQGKKVRNPSFFLP